MRIIHLLNHSYKANGHVEVAVDLACEQARLGHEVFLVAGPGNFDAVLARHGVTFVELPAGGLRHVSVVMPALLRALRAIRPDIVHAHMVASAILARMARPLFRYRLITTLHNSFDRQSRLMGLGNLVIAVSDAVRREMVDKGIAPRKLRVVHNGTVNGARRSASPETIMPLAHPAIVTVAGLHPRKAIDTLIAAFASVRDRGLLANLYIVGEGPQERELEQLAAATGHGEAIHFLGYSADPRQVMGGADIFVLPSLAEPCALALIEARQMGCACLASDVGGNPEILEFGKSGQLFAPGNAAELADLLMRLIEEPAELASLRAAARSGWAYWTVERMARETIAVYQEAISPSRQPARALAGKQAVPQ